ncbi:MAG: hypothetical protein WAS73_01715, partial [Defluviicoccus sp.]
MRDQQWTTAGVSSGRTRRIAPFDPPAAAAEPSLATTSAGGRAGERAGGRWAAAPLLGDQIAPGLALLLILAGTLASVAVASFLTAREDLATALGPSWGAPLAETGARMLAVPDTDAGPLAADPAAGAAPEFGFVEASR